MPIPAENAVRRCLEPRHPIIYDAVTGGWADCRAMPQIGWWRRKGTRAAMVWEGTVERAIQSFVDDEGVRVVNHFDTRSFLVDDTVLFRFKKGDVRLFSRNYPTQLALAFHDHRDDDLFGYGGLMRVEVVHTLNPRETEIESVVIIARDRRRVFWWYNIGGETRGRVLPFPVSAGPDQRPTRDLARPRRTPIEANDEIE